MKSWTFVLLVLIPATLGSSHRRHLGRNDADTTTDLPVVNTVLPEVPDYTQEELRAKEFLKSIEPLASAECTKAVFADWKFASNITDENQEASVKAALGLAKFRKELWKNVTRFSYKNFEDPLLRRQLRFMANLGTDALPAAELEKFTNLVNDMSSIYSTAKVCAYDNSSKCDLALQPHLKEILAKSRDYAQLEHAWLSWRDASGKKIGPLYPQYVQLINKAAEYNSFNNAVEQWLMPYDSPTFREDVYKLWDQISPLYQQLHAYVRRKLSVQYGLERVSRTSAIPAHLLGDMWAQHWSDLLDFTVPFPGRPSVDVTENMIKQNYTALKMFQVSEEFFKSVNLSAMPAEFWKESIIEKPKDREIICHASAWDFCNGVDFRIKQCSEVKMSDLVVTHHEMGHILYYLLYKNQPITFREGANPGFHEAVGDLLALSVSTPKHLKEIGLLDDFEDDEAFNINYLFSQAMDKVAFIPSALVIDQWRWDVFQGTVEPDDYNCHWWKLRTNYQGVKPPRTRASTDFDPGSKYHVPANVPYIRYFVSHVIQFQFHRALCIAAGQYDPNDPAKPLHKCDIYNSAAAGNKLGAMLELGSSRPWPDAMEQITGQREMDASAIMEYFQPLYEWLKAENAKTGEVIGWKDNVPACVSAKAA